MEELTIDTGLRAYAVNGGPERGGGVLRMNPNDPNLYHRIDAARRQLAELERQAAETREGAPDGDDAVTLLAQADRRAKEVLAEVFGPGNNFDEMLGGASLFAVADNGELVITNFFAALQPVLADGAQRYAEARARLAVRQAEAKRAARGAVQ